MKPRLTGHGAFLALLADEGVDQLFGNPGATELAIMEALGRRSDIRCVLGLQESAVLGMADGLARASNRVTAANVHVAPIAVSRHNLRAPQMKASQVVDR